MQKMFSFLKVCIESLIYIFFVGLCFHCREIICVFLLSRVLVEENIFPGQEIIPYVVQLYTAPLHEGLEKIMQVMIL